MGERNEMKKKVNSERWDEGKNGQQQLLLHKDFSFIKWGKSETLKYIRMMTVLREK